MESVNIIYIQDLKHTNRMYNYEVDNKNNV